MPWLRAALDTPFGAKPYGEVLRISRYLKDASAAAIYPGDFVIQEADGGIAVATTTATNIIGVAAMYSAASTEEVNFLVYDHPEQLFAIQDDNAGTLLNEASIGLNADITVTTGDTTTLRSLHELDSSTAATTAGLALKIIGVHPIEARSFAAAADATNGQRKWIVKISSHLYGGYDVTGV